MDDSELRIERFKRQEEKFNVVIVARTAQEAIEALSNTVFDAVYLDHDLGGKQFQSSEDENCGMAVARWILKNKPVIPNIVVHSWNIPAAQRMTQMLKGAGYRVAQRPFNFGIDLR